jgi:hypothetical protein
MSTGRVAAAALIAACVVRAVGVRAAAAQAVPPKTIADILALLEQEKPDPAKLAKLRAETDSEPPVPAGAATLSNSISGGARRGRSPAVTAKRAPTSIRP